MPRPSLKCRWRVISSWATVPEMPMTSYLVILVIWDVSFFFSLFSHFQPNYDMFYDSRHISALINKFLSTGSFFLKCEKKAWSQRRRKDIYHEKYQHRLLFKHIYFITNTFTTFIKRLHYKTVRNQHIEC